MLSNPAMSRLADWSRAPTGDPRRWGMVVGLPWGPGSGMTTVRYVRGHLLRYLGPLECAAPTRRIADVHSQRTGTSNSGTATGLWVDDVHHRSVVAVVQDGAPLPGVTPNDCCQHDGVELFCRYALSGYGHRSPRDLEPRYLPHYPAAP